MLSKRQDKTNLTTCFHFFLTVCFCRGVVVSRMSEHVDTASDNAVFFFLNVFLPEPFQILVTAMLD